MTPLHTDPAVVPLGEDELEVMREPVPGQVGPPPAPAPDPPPELVPVLRRDRSWYAASAEVCDAEAERLRRRRRRGDKARRAKLLRDAELWRQLAAELDAYAASRAPDPDDGGDGVLW